MAAKLNREVIARAGLRLLDESGVDGVTLRALAADLGVQAPTLYWHVKSKQDIFAAMASAISQDAATATAAIDRDAPWQERLQRWAYAMRLSILSHRDGGRVFAGTFAADPATYTVTEAALTAWIDAGLPVEQAAQRMILLRHFIVGFCIEEQELGNLGSQGDPGQLKELRDTLNPKIFPLTAQALPLIARSDADDRFNRGLQLMLQLKSE
ncbi:TetR/AcrR family transcriptional regulator C-terminal domain-containing protein [Mycobacteroides franklinii]|uniref:Tetracycline repressor protein class E n=1 Tax=Mycobacteroides franklinii TaxID=948102 RepID=A0A4R8RLN8_9MYCO|nr:TetR/AcrR family transcriptional regulator C-terminal domain-containing protein [Mycobacteroides franklinii]TDZ45952.1 Tetracycline repressor protein class E [Mycobacteroides franklinii]TDZ53567.1 Tetracycline repressor protein class E [Mycobacteroides franklinii]TDZ59622.1 Tetracycline repressor protein class E [Mycobacteroides franklinii]TDZ67137.1 Tetracycline repressor protein class E [Mycobacteroides franklinii]TDZ73061.1 Tetracycline repressor protein class E [Mycobacteroides franklin